ncbi:MAG: YfhO family protein, partial [Bacteroides sp.]
PYAYGNAWFVDKVTYVANANEEIDAVGRTDLQTTAIVDSRFKEQLQGVTQGFKDSLSTIRLTSYEPNELVYEVSTPQAGIVVFSEIYYPGWQATIDGQPAEIARADYILRAMQVPAGKHTIVMRFDPKSLHVTESIAYGALALILIAIIALLFIYRKRLATKEREDQK